MGKKKVTLLRYGHDSLSLTSLFPDTHKMCKKGDVEKENQSGEREEERIKKKSPLKQ